MNQKQLGQEPELRHRVVADSGRLQSLLASDSNTDMGFLNHGNVVGTVSNGKSDGLDAFANHVDKAGLLTGRCAATNHRVNHDDEIEEQRVQSLIALDHSKSLPINDDNRVCNTTLADVNNGCGYALLDILSLIVENGNGRVVFDEPARVADVDGRLSLVARQHPHFNVGTAELVDGLRHALLQLVFDGGSASQLEVLLNHLTGALNQVLAIHQTGCGIEVNLLPALVFAVVQETVAVEQRSQTFGGKVVDVLEAALNDGRLVHDERFFDEVFLFLQLH